MFILFCLGGKIHQQLEILILAVPLSHDDSIMYRLLSKIGHHFFLQKAKTRRPTIRKQCQPHSTFSSFCSGEVAGIGT
jgi:hypothetical protein